MVIVMNEVSNVHQVKHICVTLDQFKDYYLEHNYNENMFNSGLNIVVIARAGAGKADFHKIESALLHVMRLHNVIIK